MATMWRRTMSYLGLAPDDEFEEYDGYDEGGSVATQAPPTAAGPRVVRPVQAVPENQDPPRTSTVRPEPMKADPPRSSSVRPIPADTEPAASKSSVVRPITGRSGGGGKPKVLSPRGFPDAQQVADEFKAEAAVIMNLQSVDRDLARRLVDFASGLCYGLGGQMDKVADNVFLLTPTDVELTADEKRRLQERYDS